MEFLNKWYLLGLLFIPIVVYLYYIKQKKNGVKFKFIDDLQKVFGKYNYLFGFKMLLLSSILIVFIIVFANPNKVNVNTDVKKNGIDIAFVLDVSESMNAQDLKPTRIKAAKHIISSFISKLKNDRVGLVVFAGKPFVSLPLTFDYNIVKQTLSGITTSILNKQAGLGGTAIGDGLLMAQTLFKKPAGMSEKNYKKRQKIVILLTDGDANKGVNPVIAAEYLKKYGIKVYTIGIGSLKGGYIDYNNGFFIQKARIAPMNPKALIQIAKLTGGKFYRATDTKTLKNIFDDLQKLTKTDIKVKVKKVYNPEYMKFLYLLVILLGLYIYLKFREI